MENWQRVLIAGRPCHHPIPSMACRRAHGFTITELVVTIVVAGILAAAVLPRWRGQTGFEERGFRDETVAALRFAQKAAISARRAVCASFVASQVSFQISSQTPETAAAGCLPNDPLLVLANGKTAVLGSSYSDATFVAPPASIVFDASGRNVGAQATITVTNLPSLPITVEAETGYVH